MKKRILVVTLAALAAASFALAQSQPTGQKTLAATMDVYVFPTAGQDAQQQSVHEAECYNWAVQNTGTDPFALSKQAEAQQQQTAAAKEDAKSVGAGAGAQGAVRGAAASLAGDGSAGTRAPSGNSPRSSGRFTTVNQTAGTTVAKVTTP